MGEEMHVIHLHWGPALNGGPVRSCEGSQCNLAEGLLSIQEDFFAG